VLVKGFGKTRCLAAPGPVATVAGMKAASYSQKLWRFCIDGRVAEADLIASLHEAVHRAAAERPGVLLAIHDWSTLSFGNHDSKKDRETLTHEHDLG
jgi:hypothetical protein